MDLLSFGINVSPDLLDTVYAKPNYVIEDTNCDNNVCAIYFSSSGIYFPTDDDSFKKAFIDDDKFEWWKSRFPNARRHIFVRDIVKYFYAFGISYTHPNVEALLDLLKEKTNGFEVITIGSSAGGYAAILFGLLLRAKAVYSFSGYANLHAINKKKWPLLFSDAALEEFSGYFNVKEFVDKNSANTNIFYFYSTLYQEDVQQFKEIAGLKNFHCVGVASRVHGVQIGKTNLQRLMSFSTDDVIKMFAGKRKYSFFRVTWLLNGKKNALHCVKECVAYYMADMKAIFKKIVGKMKKFIYIN